MRVINKPCVQFILIGVTGMGYKNADFHNKKRRNNLGIEKGLLQIGVYGTLEDHVSVLINAGFTYKHACKLALKDRLKGTYSYHVPPYSYHNADELYKNIRDTSADIIESQRIAYEANLTYAHRDYAVSWGAQYEY